MDARRISFGAGDMVVSVVKFLDLTGFVAWTFGREEQGNSTDTNLAIAHLRKARMRGFGGKRKELKKERGLYVRSQPGT
jgi:hypothetical protein